MSWVACTRMYDVTPGVQAHWHALMRLAAQRASVEIECIAHAAPKPLTDLWARQDQALAFMCGLALATRYPAVRPLAAPVTVIANSDTSTYQSAWLVSADSTFDSLESTFGGRVGWLAEHSHSGFNGPRHALQAYRSADRPRLYRESIGPLEHPRGALRALAEDRVDVVALDAWWWWLLQRHEAGTASRFRAIDRTAFAPIPPIVCAERLPAKLRARLAATLLAIHDDEAAANHLDALGIRRFASAARADFDVLADLDRAARAAGYLLPA